MTNHRRRRAPLRALTAIVATAALMGGLAACSGSGSTPAPAESIGPDGVDDGSTLTLWTRAPLEKQANLLVDAYNASHENQVELTVVPNDDYVAKVGAAAGSDGLPDLFAADIVYVPNWVEQGLFQDISAQIDGLAVQGRDQPGPPVGRHRRRQGARAAVRARPLDAVLEQGPLHRGGARPREGARPTSPSSPRTRRRSRRSARTASTAPRPASTAADASSSPGSRACGPTAKRC